MPVTRPDNFNNRECFNPFIDPFQRPHIYPIYTIHVSYRTRGHSQSRLLPLQTARLLRLANYREPVVSHIAYCLPLFLFAGASHARRKLSHPLSSSPLSRPRRESSIFPRSRSINVRSTGTSLVGGNYKGCSESAGLMRVRIPGK